MKQGDRIKLLRPGRWCARLHEDIPIGTTGTVYEFTPIPTQPGHKMYAVRFDRLKAKGDFHFGLTQDREGQDFIVVA